MAVGMDQEQLRQELLTYRGMWGSANLEPQQRLDLNIGEGFGGGIMANPLVPMLLQPLISSFFGHGGMMPAQFAPVQSFYDQHRAKQYWQGKQLAMQTASQADRETYVRIIRGIGQMQGTPWGLEQQRSANVMAGDMATMAPFFAMAMPEVFDAAHGIRGSATVMSSFLHRAGLQAVDPTTGRTGLSGASAGTLAAEMHRRFFGEGADLAAWRGITAGQAGAMYDELQAHGVMGRSIGTMSRARQFEELTGTAAGREDMYRLIRQRDPERFAALLAATPAAAAAAGNEQVRQLAAAPGLARQTVEALQRETPNQFDALLRGFDANRVGNRLKDMAGAVSAMREIFGDIGRPNAPMKELIDGLDKLTQGGLATMNPAQLERTVRTTQVIARSSGLGMQAFEAFAAGGAASARARGIEPIFGLRASQAAAEFGAAYGQVGEGDLGGWGRRSREELSIMERELQLNAAASPMANRLGATARLFEAQERGLGQGNVQGPLANLMKAIRTPGARTFINERGEQESLDVTEERWFQLMQASKVDPAMARAYLRAPAANREFIDRFNIGQNLVRPRQGEELAGLLALETQGVVLNQLQETAPGMDVDRRRDIARNATLAMTTSAMNMSQADWLDMKKRDTNMRTAARESVVAQLKATNPGMTDDQANAQFNSMFPAGKFGTMAAGVTGLLAQRVIEAPYGYASWAAVRDLNRPEVRERTRVIGEERQAEVALRTALGGMAQAPWLARLMDEFQQPSPNLGAAVAKVMGGVNPEDILKSLGKVDVNALEAEGGLGAKKKLNVLSQALVESVQQFREVQGNAKLTPEQKTNRLREITGDIEAIQQGGDTARQRLRGVLEDAGVLAKGADEAAFQAARQRVLDPATKGISDELRKRVGYFTTAGGAADKEKIRRDQNEIYKKMGFEDKDFDLIREGKMDDDPRMKDARFAADRERLKQLGELTGGLTVQGDAAGIDLKAKIGARDLVEASARTKELDEARKTAIPSEKGAARDEAIAIRKRHAKASYDLGRQASNYMLGNLGSLEGAGAGSFAKAKAIKGRYDEMARLAAKAKVSVEDILAGTAVLPKGMEGIGDEVRALEKANTGDRDWMAERMQLPADKRTPMPEAEKKEWTEYFAEQTQTDTDKNKAIISSMVREMGIMGDEAEEARLKDVLGEGPESAQKRYALQKKIDARKALKNIAQVTGISMEELKKSKGAEGLVAEAGELMGFSSMRTITEAVEQSDTQIKSAIAAEAANKQATTGGGQLDMKGELILTADNRAVITGSGSMNTTPVAGS